MTKSLGQIAYEAWLGWFRPELEVEILADSWVAEPEKHEAWQAAAEAVKKECARNFNAFMEAQDNRVADAECAVIEAARKAKSAIAECSTITAGGFDPVLDALVEALEALEEGEVKRREKTDKYVVWEFGGHYEVTYGHNQLHGGRSGGNEPANIDDDEELDALHGTIDALRTELERLVKEWRAMAESLRDQALDAENRGEDWAFLERVIADGWEQAASRLAGALRRTAEEDG